MFFFTVVVYVFMGCLKDTYLPILQFNFVVRASDIVFK